MSPLQKGYVTAETRRSQRKILSRITHTHAAPCIHRVRFQGSLHPRRLCGAFLQQSHLCTQDHCPTGTRRATSGSTVSRVRLTQPVTPRIFVIRYQLPSGVFDNSCTVSRALI
jgi:hypothetical protein